MVENMRSTAIKFRYEKKHIAAVVQKHILTTQIKASALPLWSNVRNTEKEIPKNTTATATTNGQKQNKKNVSHFF